MIGIQRILMTTRMRMKTLKEEDKIVLTLLAELNKTHSQLLLEFPKKKSTDHSQEPFLVYPGKEKIVLPWWAWCVLECDMVFNDLGSWMWQEEDTGSLWKQSFCHLSKQVMCSISCLCQIPTRLLLVKIVFGVSGEYCNLLLPLHCVSQRFVHVAEQEVLVLSPLCRGEVWACLQPLATPQQSLELSDDDWRAKAPQTHWMQPKFSCLEENFICPWYNAAPKLVCKGHYNLLQRKSWEAQLCTFPW